MDNLAPDLIGMDDSTLNLRFPFRGLSPKLPLDPRLLSFSAINSPGQPLTNQVTAERYLESWPNFFAPFPAGILYPTATAVSQVFALLRLSVGGELALRCLKWRSSPALCFQIQLALIRI